MKMQSFLEDELEKELMYLVGNIKSTQELSGNIRRKLQRKKESFLNRRAQIVKGTIEAEVLRIVEGIGEKRGDYLLTHQLLVKQDNQFYMEERKEERTVYWSEDYGWNQHILSASPLPIVPPMEMVEGDLERGHYNRIGAVQYAESWWNGTNPKYKRHENDCTNFISQCLHAGGFPMRYTGSVKSGWWYSNHQFSYAWGVAHTLLYYLIGLKKGIRGRRVDSIQDLKIGDIIFYDFEGDGRFDHSTIVVAKDNKGEPLVNAHTMDSRNRYWTYEDSSRYTPQMKYRFISIIDG